MPKVLSELVSELGVELQAELREQGEQIDGVIAIAEHGRCSPERHRKGGIAAHPAVYRRLWNRSISHRKLTLRRGRAGDEERPILGFMLRHRTAKPHSATAWLGCGAAYLDPVGQEA